MKHLVKILTLGAALIASVSIASATPISGSIGLSGDGTYSASGAFVSTDAPGGAYVNVAGTGSLLGFTKFNPATFYNFNTGTTVGALSPTQLVFTTTETINSIVTTLTFTLTGVSTAPSNNGVGYGFGGYGILSETGYTDTMANFTLNTNASAGTFITFNTVAATPEPSSLIMLGTGLMSAAGMMVRRRKIS